MSNKTNLKMALSILIILSLFFSGGRRLEGSKDWAGVDKTVIEKFAQEHGRKSWKPFINTDRGDLLLFVFLLAGAAGGFVLGFCWRKFFSENFKKHE